VTIRFVKEAQGEFNEAIDYYEDARPGLGRRFKEQVDRAVLRVAAHPELWHLRPGRYRRINLRVFPYYIPYAVRGETLWVLAVAHTKRSPEYWIDRRDQIT
jgi:plasmid stabilization system protein ParE